MNNDKFRDHHFTQHDLTGLGDRLDLGLRYFRREIAKQRIDRNHNGIYLIFFLIFFRHPHLLQCELLCKNLNTRNTDGTISRCGNFDCILGKWLIFGGFHRVFKRRRIKRKFFRHSRIIRAYLLHFGIRVPRIGNGDSCSLDRSSGPVCKYFYFEASFIYSLCLGIFDIWHEQPLHTFPYIICSDMRSCSASCAKHSISQLLNFYFRSLSESPKS